MQPSGNATRQSLLSSPPAYVDSAEYQLQLQQSGVANRRDAPLPPTPGNNQEHFSNPRLATENRISMEDRADNSAITIDDDDQVTENEPVTPVNLRKKSFLGMNLLARKMSTPELPPGTPEKGEQYFAAGSHERKQRGKLTKFIDRKITKKFSFYRPKTNRKASDTSSTPPSGPMRHPESRRPVQHGTLEEGVRIENQRDKISELRELQKVRETSDSYHQALRDVSTSKPLQSERLTGWTAATETKQIPSVGEVSADEKRSAPSSVHPSKLRYINDEILPTASSEQDQSSPATPDPSPATRNLQKNIMRGARRRFGDQDADNTIEDQAVAHLKKADPSPRAGKAAPPKRPTIVYKPIHSLQAEIVDERNRSSPVSATPKPDQPVQEQMPAHQVVECHDMRQHPHRGSSLPGQNASSIAQGESFLSRSAEPNWESESITESIIDLYMPGTTAHPASPPTAPHHHSAPVPASAAPPAPPTGRAPHHHRASSPTLPFPPPRSASSASTDGTWMPARASPSPFPDIVDLTINTLAAGTRRSRAAPDRVSEAPRPSSDAAELRRRDEEERRCRDEEERRHRDEERQHRAEERRVSDILLRSCVRLVRRVQALEADTAALRLRLGRLERAARAAGVPLPWVNEEDWRV